MARQKKPPGAGTPALPPLPPEAAAALQDLLARVAAALEEGRDPENLRQLAASQTGDEAFDLRLIAALGALAHPGVPGLLAALFRASPDKPRRKALKRALHLLKTRGVPVPDTLLPREEVLPRQAPGRGKPAQAHISPVLGNGERYVILEGPKEILGGNFLVARLSDQQGIRECHILSLKSSQRQEFWDHLKEQGLGEWARPPVAYALRLLDAAAALDPAAEGGGRYRSLKARIQQEWGHPEEAPGEEALLPPMNPGEQSRLGDQSRDLAANPLFLTWLPGPEEVAPWLQKIKEVQDSPLVLSEAQRQARIDSVVDEATQALYPAETRDLCRGRLLAMAYFLDLRGQSQEARLAQAAALDLAAPARGPLAGEHPFLKALVWTALQLAWKYQEGAGEEKPASPLLTPPTDSLLIRR